MASFEQGEDPQYYYYHWFWGLSKVKKDQSPPLNNMKVLVDLLTQDPSQQLLLEAQVLSIEKKNPFVYFFYWLFNIDNFSLNKHKLSIAKALTENNEEKNNMNSTRPPKNTSWFTWPKSKAQPPVAASSLEKETKEDSSPTLDSDQPVSVVNKKDSTESKSEDDQEERDIVDEVQFILAGGYDHLDTETLFPLPELKDFCCNLHGRMYSEILQPKQSLILPMGILQSFNSYFSTNYEREILKKYHSRFSRVLQLLNEKILPLGPAWQGRSLTSTPESEALADNMLIEIDLLLISKLRSMLLEMPKHTQLKDFLSRHDTTRKEKQSFYKSLPERELTITEDMLEGLKILGLQGKKRGNPLVFSEIQNAYKSSVLRSHPDQKGDSEEFNKQTEARNKFAAQFYGADHKERTRVFDLRVVWAEKHKELEDKMNSITGLEPSLRIAIWKNVLKKEEESYARETSKKYTCMLDTKIESIKAGIKYLNHLKLSLAVKAGNQTLVESLLDAGTNPDGDLLSYFASPPRCILEEDYKPLFLAIRLKDSTIFKMLLEVTTDVSIKNIFGCSLAEQIGTSRFWATAEKNKMLSALSEKDQGISLPPILQTACLGDQEAVMKESKEDLTVVDSFNNTVLHYAAANGHTELCKSLYESDNTLITKKNKHGFTPIMWAVLNGHIAVVKLLLSYGATLDEKTKKGTSTIGLARTDEMRAFLNSYNPTTTSTLRSRSALNNNTSPPPSSLRRYSVLFASQPIDTVLAKASQPTTPLPVSPNPTAVPRLGGGG